MADDNNSGKILPVLPEADSTGSYQFSDESRQHSAIRAVTGGDEVDSLPKPDETPPYKKGV